MKKVLAFVVITTLFFVACGKQKTEKQRFIDATIKVACMVFQSGDFSDLQKLEDQTKKIFSEYGFKVEDEAAMKVLTDKYSTDKEVEDALKKALQECAGDVMEKLNQQAADQVKAGEPVAGEEAAKADENAPEVVVEEAEKTDTGKAMEAVEAAPAVK